MSRLYPRSESGRIWFVSAALLLLTAPILQADWEQPYQSVPSELLVLFTAVDLGPCDYNQPPYEPSDPNPSHGATGVLLDTALGWTGGDPDLGDWVRYDLYLGSDTIPPMVASNLEDSFWDPGGLDQGQVYYWRVVARDSLGVETEGPTWIFYTEFTGPPPLAVTADIETSQDMYYPGDPFLLTLDLVSTTATSQDVFIALDFYGDYWFWPSWVQYPPDFDYQTWLLDTGLNHSTILDFPWPEVQSYMAGVVFHVATLDNGTDYLRGYDACAWGWNFGPTPTPTPIPTATPTPAFTPGPPVPTVGIYGLLLLGGLLGLLLIGKLRTA